MPEAVIVSAARTPIGRAFKGSLKDVRPDDLAAQVVDAALAKVPGLDRSLVEDLYLGCAEPSGRHGNNMARVVSVLLGMDTVPGATVNRFCASSVQTTRMAAHAIKAGEGDIFISAGVECVSQYTNFAGAGASDDADLNPRFADAMARTLETAKTNARWSDPRESGELPDVYIAMGQTAENVATYRGVSRQEQDEWAVRSQNFAEKAIADGFFAREIAPVTLADGTVVSTDDGPRAGVTYDTVAGLKPVFREEGTVTAGNCCPLNDGAAALVVMSDTRAAELGLTPLARIVSTGLSALSPEIMGLGPVEASRQALARAGMSIDDVDLVEINEAFAAVPLLLMKEMGWTEEQTNVNGGAIAMGHPLGATGAMILGTLVDELERRDLRTGIATLCIGAGMGVATIVERV